MGVKDEPLYPFLRLEGTSVPSEGPNKLSQYVVNNIRLGQWAIARASLPQLYHESPSVLRELLQLLAVKPSAAQW